LRRVLSVAHAPHARIAAMEPPPLYKPEQCEPKKRLTLLQRCYLEPWIPAGATLRHLTPARG
jgi:hypothetical protein